MVRTSASGFVDSSLIPSRVKSTIVKLVFSAFVLDNKGTVWRPSRQVNKLCYWESNQWDAPHYRVAERWPATPKQLVVAPRSISRDGRINMHYICNQIQIQNTMTKMTVSTDNFPHGKKQLKNLHFSNTVQELKYFIIFSLTCVDATSSRVVLT